jgi:hypothetical protein
MQRLSAQRQSSPQPDAARTRRRAQWDALAVQWSRSTLERVRKCRRVVCDHAVSLNLTEHGAGYAGLTTCGSVWACPRCSAQIWARRADELDQGVRAWDASGGKVAMVTLTMRHDATQPLDELWDALSKAWAAASGNYRGARDAIATAGGAGWARVVEATHGANGWHLHVHALMFVDQDADVDELGAAMFAAWASRLVGLGMSAPIATSGGLDVRTMDLSESAGEVARYVSKATYEATAAVVGELAGQHGKRAGRGNRRPWDVLRELGEHGRDHDAAIWREWEQASKGRRAIGWKRGTRELLRIGPELADEDLADDLAADVEQLELVARIVKTDWAELVRIPGAPAQLLDLAELAPKGAAAELVDRRLAELLGRPPRDYANNCGRVPLVAELGAALAVDEPVDALWPNPVRDTGRLLYDRTTGEVLIEVRTGTGSLVRGWAIDAHAELPQVSTIAGALCWTDVADVAATIA